MNGKPPLAQWYMATLENGSNRDGELASAFAAMINARTSRFAAYLTDTIK
jgi:hypothetical protein